MASTETSSLECPHCRVRFHTGRSTFYNFDYVNDNQIHLLYVGKDADAHWWMEKAVCPSCGRFTLRLIESDDAVPGYDSQMHVLWPKDSTSRTTLIRPKVANRPPVPIEVPDDFGRDYREACLVLTDSPKASAALSRRCLQHILREKAGVKSPNDLAKAIQEVVEDPAVPPDVSTTLDMVRNIGNFSAHPNKSQSTGEIVEVEPMEAEWCLDTIEILYNYYFVRPAEIEKRIQAVNAKLDDTGKPQMPTAGQGV